MAKNNLIINNVLPSCMFKSMLLDNKLYWVWWVTFKRFLFYFIIWNIVNILYMNEKWTVIVKKLVIKRDSWIFFSISPKWWNNFTKRLDIRIVIFSKLLQFCKYFQNQILPFLFKFFNIFLLFYDRLFKFHLGEVLIVSSHLKTVNINFPTLCI